MDKNPFEELDELDSGIVPREGLEKDVVSSYTAIGSVLKGAAFVVNKIGDVILGVLHFFDSPESDKQKEE